MHLAERDEGDNKKEIPAKRTNKQRHVGIQGNRVDGGETLWLGEENDSPTVKIPETMDKEKESSYTRLLEKMRNYCSLRYSLLYLEARILKIRSLNNRHHCEGSLDYTTIEGALIQGNDCNIPYSWLLNCISQHAIRKAAKSFTEFNLSGYINDKQLVLVPDLGKSHRRQRRRNRSTVQPISWTTRL